MSKYIVKLASKVISYEWWGKAWCQNIENYADQYNRLERGRAYLRKGAIKELQIEEGHIKAIVAGTRPDPYDIEIFIEPVSQSISNRVLKQIEELNIIENDMMPDKLFDLFTMNGGLFPTPKEINVSCSCPDGAKYCKHVLAVLYAIGSILDKEPWLLFKLRGIDVNQYLDKKLKNATNEILIDIKDHKENERIIDDDMIPEFFGIDVENMEIHPINQLENVEQKDDVHIIELLPKKKIPLTIVKEPKTKRNPIEGYCIRQYDFDGNFIAQYSSYEELETNTSVGLVNVKRACTGLKKSAGGYILKKMSVDEPITNIPPIEMKTEIVGARPVDCFNDDGTLVAHFDSISAASRETGINAKSIRETAKGLQKHAGGYLWRFCEESDELEI